MNNEHKKGLVPKLRFPEFLDSEKWEKSTLGDIATIKSGSTPLRSNLEFFEGGNIPWVKTTDLNNSFIFKTEECITTKANARINPEGSILVAMYGGFNQIGRTGYLKVPAATNQAISVLNADKKKVLSIYLLIWLNAKVEDWKRVASSSRKDPNITGSDVVGFPIIYPEITEQQKIAACLSSLDDLVTAQTQKIEALKIHKKGLMQQLFPQEGETVPKLRFPEFMDSGEWVMQPLKKVFSIFQGFAFSSTDSIKDGIRWLKIADVSIQRMNHESPSYLPLDYKEKYEKFSVKVGDYVIALTRPILNKQLKIAPVDIVFDGALLNQRVGKLVMLQNKVFVYYLLQTTQLINEIDNSIAGSEPPNLSAQQIENIEIYIPSLADEQQKIADCLSSLDDLINAHVKKCELLKTHKKGLMQGLFPSSNEAP